MIDPEFSYRPAHMTSILMEDGRSEAEWTPTGAWANPMGNVHGGYLGVLVDDVAGMALMSMIGMSAATVNLQVDFLEAILPAMRVAVSTERIMAKPASVSAASTMSAMISVTPRCRDAGAQW